MAQAFGGQMLVVIFRSVRVIILPMFWLEQSLVWLHRAEPARLARHTTWSTSPED
jgi:hypothetical protein